MRKIEKESDIYLEQKIFAKFGYFVEIVDNSEVRIFKPREDNGIPSIFLEFEWKNINDSFEEALRRGLIDEIEATTKSIETGQKDDYQLDEKKIKIYKKYVKRLREFQCIIFLNRCYESLK